MESGNSNMYMLFIAVLMAMFGGMVKYISQLTKKRFSAIAFWSSILVSAFTGLIVGLICRELATSDNITFIATGISGWSGGVIIDKLAKKLEGKLDEHIKLK